MNDGHPDRFLEDFDDFFEETNLGHLNLAPDGTVIRANSTFAKWLDYSPEELTGRRFSDCLSLGGKVLFETHLSPLLRMQGFLDEIALEVVTKSGAKLPIFASGFERRNSSGQALFIRMTLFQASGRRGYEENLRLAKTAAEVRLADEEDRAALREQFIAVLGHDLRNPLNAVVIASSILETHSLSSESAEMVKIISSSSARMANLISDVLDFARGRLGGGILIDSTAVDLMSILQKVVDELQIASPGRTLVLDVQIKDPVLCDPTRFSQLVSNLVANALTHGSQDAPVFVEGVSDGESIRLSVRNKGEPIPPNSIEKLFQPFKRNDERPSKQGLGLGLFIAHHIAVGHGGSLDVTSTVEETCFTFRMPKG